MWCFHYCSPCCDNLFLSSRGGFTLLPGSSQRTLPDNYRERPRYNVRRISSFGRSHSDEAVSDVTTVSTDRSCPYVRHRKDQAQLATRMLPPQDACTTTIHMVQPMAQDYNFDSSEENVNYSTDVRESANDTLSPDDTDTPGKDATNRGRQQIKSDMKRAGTEPDVSSVASSRSPSSERLPWLKAQSTLTLHKISSKLSKLSASTLGLNTDLYQDSLSRNSLKTQKRPTTPENEEEFLSANPALPPDYTNPQPNPAGEQDQLPRSMTPSDRAPDQVYGTVFFSTAYDSKNKKFTVHLERIIDLPPKSEQVKYDVIVKLTILPSEKQTKKSRQIKQTHHNLNPEFNETFTFTMKGIKGKTLRISLFDSERQGKYDAVGHALLPIADVVTEKLERFHMKLYQKSQPNECSGLIQISLSYLSTVSRLTVITMQAKKLSASQKTFIVPNLEKYDTYVKVTLVCGGHKMKTKKSSVIPNDKNPNYNQAFNFLVPQGFLDDSCIVVKVMLRGVLKRDITIGKVILGPFFYSQGRTLTTWGRAIKSKEVLTQWHGLYL